jgi:1-deoxy-D-xylulose-5-phosphate reductoisomerase
MPSPNTLNASAPAPAFSAASGLQRVAVLGATGSIGSSALDVIARHPERLRAEVLVAGRQVDALVALCRRHRPAHAVLADPSAYAPLRDALQAAGLDTQAHAGPEVIDAFAADPSVDTVVAAIVGAAGLSSTLAAARAGKRLLLANKESLVLAGDLLMAAARANGTKIVPIDSEHNAVFQCLPDAPPGTQTDEHTSSDVHRSLKRIILTASGGPFRGRSRAQLRDITPAQAVAHPKWSMGPKISVDSATLMNKGLEVIEAHHLFGLPQAQIDVLVHPQSLVHALVEFIDGSILAQLGLPDMRTALAVGFGWPERMASGVGSLDLLAHGRLEFEAPDLDTFPCLRLAYEALRAGGSAPAILNAANEEAVSAFLHGKIGFLAIPELVEHALDRLSGSATEWANSLEGLLNADVAARELTRDAIAATSSKNTRPLSQEARL